jgi:hypothetical protein
MRWQVIRDGTLLTARLLNLQKRSVMPEDLAEAQARHLHASVTTPSRARDTHRFCMTSKAPKSSEDMAQMAANPSAMEA